jgi:hypothetical protein
MPDGPVDELEGHEGPIACGSISLMGVQVDVYSDDSLNIAITDYESAKHRQTIKHPLNAEGLDPSRLLEIVAGDLRACRGAKRPREAQGSTEGRGRNAIA